MAKRERGKSPLGVRLEHIREKVAGTDSVSAFRQRLMEGAEDSGFSDAAVRYYHMGQDYEGWRRDAPWPYLQQVLEVFPEVRAEWLIAGRGEPTRGEQAAHEAIQAEAEKTLEATWVEVALNTSAVYSDLPLSERGRYLDMVALLAGLTERDHVPEEAFIRAVGTVDALISAPLEIIGRSATAGHHRYQQYVALLITAMELAVELPATEATEG